MTTVDPAERVTVTVVHTVACHFCDDAEMTLAELAGEFPLRVERVEASEPCGAELVREHRAGMFPLVLVDGAFFSVGRLPRKKLRKLLARRTSAVA